MAELDPAELAERVLQLKRTRPFDVLDAEDLAVLAAAGREVVVAGRKRLVAEGERASAHWVALAGGLRVCRGGDSLHGEPIGDGYGGLSILTDQPWPCDLVAEPGTVLFELDADALFETLEERGRMARTVAQAMARSALAVRRQRAAGPSSPVVVAPHPDRGPWDLVSRMMAIRSAVGWRSRNAAVLTRLARASRIQKLTPGQSLWADPSAPADLVVVVEGGVDGRPDDEKGPASGRGAVYGLMESLASLPREPAVLATTEGTALVVGHAEIQEALEDDHRICLELIRLAALDLWHAFWERHPLQRPDPGVAAGAA